MKTSFEWLRAMGSMRRELENGMAGAWDALQEHNARRAADFLRDVGTNAGGIKRTAEMLIGEIERKRGRNDKG